MIIVTGASRGLGRSVAERLISSGREVLSLSRTSEGAPGDSVTCDVSDYEAVKTVAQSLRKEKREIEGLVNAAGIASMNLAVTTPPSMTQKLIQTNLAGTIHCCQLFAPLMIRKKAGSIINFSTIAVTLGLKGESIYAASKAGVEGFSRAFAREMADFDIRVNCIAPGPIKTDLLKGVSDEQIDAIVAQQILPKLFLPDDIADLCEFLLGPQSQSLSGQVLKVGGA
ncbi:MAG: SDR family oxidoreductase [Verrucomicrobiota bacterium]|nr:SDR family oxidoreductase [Verrucomicrobiota bacterium]MEC8789674.1 SDR family oxidoreductase [Verrucomicrobiota bacterium]